MNRDQYRAAYREARKQAAFILTFHARLDRLAPTQRTFPEQAPGFNFTRLQGDRLFLVGGRHFKRDRRSHASLLDILRYERKHFPVRLPA